MIVETDLGPYGTRLIFLTMHSYMGHVKQNVPSNMHKNVQIQSSGPMSPIIHSVVSNHSVSGQ